MWPHLWSDTSTGTLFFKSIPFMISILCFVFSFYHHLVAQTNQNVLVCKIFSYKTQPVSHPGPTKSRIIRHCLKCLYIYILLQLVCPQSYLPVCLCVSDRLLMKGYYSMSPYDDGYVSCLSSYLPGLACMTMSPACPLPPLYFIPKPSTSSSSH